MVDVTKPKSSASSFVQIVAVSIGAAMLVCGVAWWLFKPTSLSVSLPYMLGGIGWMLFALALDPVARKDLFGV